MALSVALVLAACGGGSKKCTSNADCAAGQTCDTAKGTCTGGTGGGTGGGATGGGTGGGATGGGTGGGATGGGTGGGATGGGTGGGATGGGTGGGSTQVDGGTIAGGETCDTAVALTSGTITFTGTTAGLTSDYDIARDTSGLGCNGYSSHPGADAVYQLSVPPRSKVSISVQGVGGDGTSMATPIYDPAIYLVASPPSNCATTTADGGVMATCIASSEDLFGSAADLLLPETLEWANVDTTARDVYLVIESGWDPTASQVDTDGDGNPDTWVIGQGDYSVTVTTAALPPPPANDACTAPKQLNAATSTMGTLESANPETFLGASPVDCREGQGGAAMKDVYYTLVVPAGQRATVVVTPSASLDPVVNVTDAPGTCTGVTACVASADSGFRGEPETVRYDNTTGAGRDAAHPGRLV